MGTAAFPLKGDVNELGQSLPLEGIRSMPRHPDEVERKKFPSTEKHSEADYLISLGFAQPASPWRGSLYPVVPYSISRS